MKLTDEQRKELWQATAAAYNHHGGKRPLRILFATQRELKTKFGWEQIAVRVIVQIVLYLLEKWMSSDTEWVDPHAMPVDFALDEQTEGVDE